MLTSSHDKFFKGFTHFLFDNILDGDNILIQVQCEILDSMVQKFFLSGLWEFLFLNRFENIIPFQVNLIELEN